MTTGAPRIYGPHDQVPGEALRPFIKKGCRICGSSGVKTKTLMGPYGPFQDSEPCPCALRRFWKDQDKLRRRMAADLAAHRERMKAEPPPAEPVADLDLYAKMLDQPQD